VRLLESDSRTSGEGEFRNIRGRKEIHIGKYGIHLRRIFSNRKENAPQQNEKLDTQTRRTSKIEDGAHGR
jgi:hypothetical protein